MVYQYLPDVTLIDVDKTLSPDLSLGGLNPCAVVPASWGDTDLTLFTRTSDYIRVFTHNGKLDRADLAGHSAKYLLDTGSPLYLKRVYDTSRKLTLVSATAFTVGDSISGDGLGSPVNDGVGTVVKVSGNDVYVSVSAGTFVTGGGVDNAAIFVSPETTISATSFATSSANVVVVDTGAIAVNAPDSAGVQYENRTSYSFGAEDLFLVVTFPGTKGNDFGVKVVSTDVSANTFDLAIYQKDTAGVLQLVRTVTLSRTYQIDNDGNQLYLEERIKEFDLPIRIVDNTARADSILPKIDATTVSMAAGAYSEALPADVVLGWDEIADSIEDFRLPLSLGSSDTTVAAKISTVVATRKYNIGAVDTIDGTRANIVIWRTSFADSNEDLGIFAEYVKWSDPYNKLTTKICPSAIVASIINRNRSTAPFKDFAGARRGSFSAIGLYNNYSDPDLDALLGVQVNPLALRFGSYHLQDQLTSQTFKSVYSNLYARLLRHYIAEKAEEFLNPELHEWNDRETREAIENGLQSILDYLTASGDLYPGSLAQCDDANNPAAVINSEELVAEMEFLPKRSAKKIKLYLVANRVTNSVTITES